MAQLKQGWLGSETWGMTSDRVPRLWLESPTFLKRVDCISRLAIIASINKKLLPITNTADHVVKVKQTKQAVSVHVEAQPDTPAVELKLNMYVCFCFQLLFPQDIWNPADQYRNQASECAHNLAPNQTPVTLPGAPCHAVLSTLVSTTLPRTRYLLCFRHAPGPVTTTVSRIAMTTVVLAWWTQRMLLQLRCLRCLLLQQPWLRCPLAPASRARDLAIFPVTLSAAHSAVPHNTSQILVIPRAQLTARQVVITPAARLENQ